VCSKSEPLCHSRIRSKSNLTSLQRIRCLPNRPTEHDERPREPVPEPRRFFPVQKPADRMQCKSCYHTRRCSRNCNVDRRQIAWKASEDKRAAQKQRETLKRLWVGRSPTSTAWGGTSHSLESLPQFDMADHEVIVANSFPTSPNPAMVKTTSFCAITRKRA
jgi:hypothetical protein